VTVATLPGTRRSPPAAGLTREEARVVCLLVARERTARAETGRAI
jgi:hypothetical protein